MKSSELLTVTDWTLVSLYGRWVVGLALLFVPFLYNPNGFHLATVCSDARLWRQWVSTDGLGGARGGARSDARGGAAASWETWWEGATPAASAYDTPALVGQTLMGAIYLYMAYAMLLASNSALIDGDLGDALGAASLWQLSLGAALVLPVMLLAAFDSLATSARRRAYRPPLVLLTRLFPLGWFLSVTQLVAPGRGFIVPVQVAEALDCH